MTRQTKATKTPKTPKAPKAMKIASPFARAAGVPEKADFAQALPAYFPPEAQDAILRLMSGLQLPLPQDRSQFMAGTDGCLLFLNRYGVVLRFEMKDERTELINESGWVLQPLAAFDLGSAVVEICPACAFEDNRDYYHLVKAELKKENINFWDTGLRQMGRMPVSTPEFPQGVPVVVDRRAVRKLSGDIAPVKSALQEQLYGPLRRAIAEAREEGGGLQPQAVARFWALCAEYVAAGKLVAGWNDYAPLPDNKWEYNTPEGPKGLAVQKMAAAYDRLLDAPRVAAPAAGTAPPRPR